MVSFSNKNIFQIQKVMCVFRFFLAITFIILPLFFNLVNMFYVNICHFYLFKEYWPFVKTANISWKHLYVWKNVLSIRYRTIFIFHVL